MLEWIRRHFSAYGSDQPRGPVIYQVEHRAYIVFELHFFGRIWTFSAHIS